MIWDQLVVDKVIKEKGRYGRYGGMAAPWDTLDFISVGRYVKEPTHTKKKR